MPPGMKIDLHEPADLIALIGQSVPTDVYALNSEGYADYLWKGPEGARQVERKTWQDLLNSLSSIEEQLMRQIAAHKDTTLMLLIEGIVVPSSDLTGGTSVLRADRNKGKIWYQSGRSRMSLQAIFSWVYQVSKYMEVFMTPTMEATAKALVAFYSSDQKEEHTTFQRHLKEVTFHPNPQVTSLMGMIPGLGPIKSEALIARLGTVWGVLSAKPAELASVHGVGIKEAERWLRRIGRPDV